MKKNDIKVDMDIGNRIHTIRGQQVVLDSDLAALYDVDVKVLNQAVKRNSNRFPEKFMFRLTGDEYVALRSQIVTLKGVGRHRKYFPYCFNEQGVAMLSAVLKSAAAVEVSIQIMNAFVNMRHLLLNNARVFQRLDTLEAKQQQNDSNFQRIFSALEQKDAVPERGVFFEGQVFDAHVAFSKIIRSARESIAILDNYIDETVLALLAKRRKGVAVERVTAD